jgi:hypothetical protein
VGDKGQPLHTTTYLKSQAQRSLNLTSLMTTTFPISGNGLSTHPLVFPLLVFPLHPDDPVTLLPLEALDGGIIGRKLSPKVSPLSRSLPGTSDCPSGDSDRGLTEPCLSLQPRRPNKSSRVGESCK